MRWTAQQARNGCASACAAFARPGAARALRTLGRAATVVALACLATACLRDVRLGDLPGDALPVDADAEPIDAGTVDARARDASADAAADATTPDAIDAAPDDATPADTGPTYALLLDGPYDTQCVDALGGREADFQILTAADCGLHVGDATLIRTSTRAWTISGPAIVDSFGLASIRMAANVFPDQPPELLVSSLLLSGEGPLGTVRRSGAIGVDRTAGTLHVDGFVGVELATPSDSGACFLTFGLTLDR